MRFNASGDTGQTILVVVAMDVEATAVHQALPAGQSLTINDSLGLSATVYQKGSNRLIVAKSGIGSVNAGVLVALAAERWRLDGIVLLGVAGALVTDLKIGDAVLATSVLQHDSVFSGETIEYMAPGKPFVSLPPAERARPVYETNDAFVAWARTAMPGIKSGCVLTGNEFVGNANRKTTLGAIAADALAVEMEAAGIIVVAERLGVPFGMVKTIADRLNPDETISHDYNSFIAGACSNAAVTLTKLWESWPGDAIP